MNFQLTKMYFYCFSRATKQSFYQICNAKTDQDLESYEFDYIDGFIIRSFATATELGNFSTEQLSRNHSKPTKATPYSHLEGTEADEKGISSGEVGLPIKKSAGQ